VEIFENLVSFRRYWERVRIEDGSLVILQVLCLYYTPNPAGSYLVNISIFLSFPSLSMLIVTVCTQQKPCHFAYTDLHNLWPAAGEINADRCVFVCVCGMCSCVRGFACIDVCLCLYAWLCVCVCVCLFVYVCVCIRVYSVSWRLVFNHNK